MDGPPPQEEDFSNLPISERIAHKNWKARVSGYESLIKTFENTASDNDPAFRPYLNNSDLLKRIVTDANAVAQEKGVECIVALVKFAGENAAKTRDTIVPALVDKCLGSTRAGTRHQALEVILQYVEVENGSAGVVNDLLPGLSVKQPKTVSGCILALKEITKIFGTNVVPTPPILKALPKIFAHSDKTVRAEGSNLTLALYQYLGPGIETWLGDLKPVQVKELKDSFENLEKEGKGHKTLKPARLTRSAAREAATATEDPDSHAEESEDLAPPDPRQFAEVIDIVPNLPSSLQTDLKSSKWKERKEVLDSLSTLLANTSRIKDAPELADLAKSLANCIAKDANINCVMVAAKCLEDLAKGMMASFSRYREAVVPFMLERLKERKVNVTDSIGLALDAVFSTSTLNDILPDLEPSLKSKNPQVKEGTLKFLSRCFATATTPIQANHVKPLAETLASLLEDGFEGARNEAATCFGYLMKMVGERPLNATMDGIADIRKVKIKEAFEKANVKCKTGTAAPPPRVPAAPPKKGGTAAKQSKQEKPPARDEDTPQSAAPSKVVAKPGAKKIAAAPPATAPSTKKLAPATATKTSGKTVPTTAGSLDSVKYKHPPEEAEALAVELIPGDVLSDLGDANWKTRLAGLDEMATWLEGQIQSLDAEVLVRTLAKRGWSEKNFQVSTKIYGILTTLAQQCPSFGRSCVAICVPHLTEKLGDLKLKRPAGDALVAFGERTSLQFVLGQAYEPLSNQKAPKVLSDALTWINTAVTEFGIAGLSLRSLIEFLKMALQNSNAAVRTSATKTLVTVKLFAGQSIKSLIEDLNSQLLNTIQNEFDKVEGQPAPEPTRTSADLATSSDSAKDTKGGGGLDPLDDLFPRVDIDSLLKGTSILADAKSDAWKTKKEALEGLQGLLDQGSNKRLKANMGDIGQILKARVTDTNKAVQSLALDIVARIATGMGKPFEKHSRLFTLPVSTVLSDQKAPIRTAALQTLAAMAEACEGLESMVSGFASALETQNPLQKSILMQWLGDWFKGHPVSSTIDLKGWAPHIVFSLDDRNSDVRKAAQNLLPSLIQYAGYDFVLQQTNALKPASRASAVPLIQAARPTVPETLAPKPPVPATTKVASSTPDPPDSPVAEAAVSPISEAKPTSKSAGVRRKLPVGTSRPDSRAETNETSSKPTTSAIKKPGQPTVTARSSTSATPVNPSLPFTNMNAEPKKMRLAKDSSRWVNEGGHTRKDLMELLQGQMEPHTNKELIARLFSHDHNAVNDYISGLTTLADFYSAASDSDDNLENLCLANLDLPLKYVSIKVHEPQPNLVSKCLDVVEAVLAFLRHVNYQLTDNEAACFVPTIIHKLGDAREQVRLRIQQIIRTLPTIYAYSRIFQLLLEHGLKAKVAKTRQGTLDELSVILKKSGMGASEPSKAFPQVAALISDKDPQVRKSALGTLSEVYTLVGEKVWSLVGPLSAKDKTQLEERLRRVPGPSTQGKSEPSAMPNPGIARLANLPRPASPSVAVMNKAVRPASPAASTRTASPAPLQNRPESPGQPPIPASAIPTSPGKSRPRSLLPSRLARPRTNLPQPSSNIIVREDPPITPVTDDITTPPSSSTALQSTFEAGPLQAAGSGRSDLNEDITLTISSILSNDPSRSVDALKKVQKILSIGPDNGQSSPQYRELAEHTEGLVETITLQMAHVFEHPKELILDENFRLAKHLIQTLNNFCDHSFLAESLTVNILTALLEELTLRLLETDDSQVKKVKDLSRFINMIILRLFATARRMSIFRALFALLLQIVKPFPSNGTLPDSKEAKVAELVLKCIWKLARNIPQDLSEVQLDPVELFPAVEHFLQSVPPNEWRARATNRVPCGDMPLRTIKVIIQHIVAHYGDDVYELLSASFDDPSATIVYPYVYRILNSSSKATNEEAIPRRNGNVTESLPRPTSPATSRPLSPQQMVSNPSNNRPSSHRTSASSSSVPGQPEQQAPVDEPDPDARLLVIIGHISSETTGALHKEGITELHQFLKAYPHKRPRVEKMLESTGAAFRKYINRALASRAAEDQERRIAVADTLSKLEHNSEEKNGTSKSHSPRSSALDGATGQERLSRLHDIFQYRSGANPPNGRTSLG